MDKEKEREDLPDVHAIRCFMKGTNGWPGSFPLC